MVWEKGELRIVKLGTARKRPGKQAAVVSWASCEVPAPYDRLVYQLTAEAEHGLSNSSHEAQRRREYAMDTLDAFGAELARYNRIREPPPAAAFRSRVLSPILQRHLRGVHDGYTPKVRNAIKPGKDKLTIEDVTEFYLSTDPADPRLIPHYRRNLLYIPEARWHLGIMMGAPLNGNPSILHFNKVRVNDDAIMENLAVEGHKEFDSNGIPLLSRVEVKAIFDEGLHTWFKEELQHVVRDISPLPSHHISHSLFPQPDRVASVIQELNITIPTPGSGQDPGTQVNAASGS
jgi:hypothetical protein